MEAQQDQKPNGAVVQEASSTTPGEDVVLTKRSLRVQTWKKIRATRSNVEFSPIFNKIPNFIDSDKAAALLAGTEEFKKAVNVKVNVDRSQDAVKLDVLSNGKNLFMTPSKESKALCSKVECPVDADEQTKRKILQRLKENRTDITLENKVTFDMVVVGSVVVSRDGYRIGKGNGFVDLDLGLLIHTGAITPETVIVTTVHDTQVVDDLPKELFQKYDCPVDMIVTPTEVIRIKNKLPRPAGIFWELLSERRLKIVQILQTIKENEEKAGKIITLKSEDTDIETNSRPRQQRRRPFYRYNRNRARSFGGNNENRNDSRPRRRPRSYIRRRQTKSEGEQTPNENKENTQNQGSNRNRQFIRRRQTSRNYCVKVSNIAKGVRVKDLKAELRKRNCNPNYISWKGGLGKCYLHFAKKKGSDRETDVDTLIESLRDLTINIQNGEETQTVSLSVELLPDNQNNRDQENNDDQTHDDPSQPIESVNTTSV